MSRGRTLVAAVLLVGLLTTSEATAPGPVVACSCIAPEPMAAHRGNSGRMIFAGSVVAVGPAGVEVAVERWYQGSGERFVRLPPDGFADSGDASCQANWPVAGSRWIWVAFVPRPGDAPQVNLCTPHARLDTPEGAAMLAEAEATFRGQPPAEPEPPPDPAGSIHPATLIPPLAAVGLVALAFVGVAVVVRRATSGR